MPSLTVILSEEQRQMVLMALAHLAIERPGWDAALSEIASKMDNKTDDGPEMYTAFKRLHLDALRDEWQNGVARLSNNEPPSEYATKEK